MDDRQNLRSQQALTLAADAAALLLASGAETSRAQETAEILFQAFGTGELQAYVLTNGVIAVPLEHSLPGGVRNVPNSSVNLMRVAAVNELSPPGSRRPGEPGPGRCRLDEIKHLPELEGLEADAGLRHRLRLLRRDVRRRRLGGPGRQHCGVCAGAAAVAGPHRDQPHFQPPGRGGAGGVGDHAGGAGAAGPEPEPAHHRRADAPDPGVALTMSIRDFISGDYLSGTIRLIDALLTAGCIACGVGLALMVWAFVLGGGAR